MAIVGPTGAGKTTLVWLSARFYDPDAGRILLDGIDLRQLRLADLRDQLSIVHAGAAALHRHDRGEHPVRPPRGDATTRSSRPRRRRTPHEFISRLPSGYGTVLGERGARLSGGERQRIAIARAFLRDAPILILDEPTSSIDSRTESIILDALDRLSDGRTTFTIAHRLSTIQRLRPDPRHGPRAGSSRPAPTTSCSRKDGLYRQLWDVQTGGRANGRESPWSRPRRDAVDRIERTRRRRATARRRPGRPTLPRWRRTRSKRPRSAQAASILAALTPEQLDALRDLDGAGLAALVGEAIRPVRTRRGGAVTRPPVVLLGHADEDPGRRACLARHPLHGGASGGSATTRGTSRPTRARRRCSCVRPTTMGRRALPSIVGTRARPLRLRRSLGVPRAPRRRPRVRPVRGAAPAPLPLGRARPQSPRRDGSAPEHAAGGPLVYLETDPGRARGRAPRRPAGGVGRSSSRTPRSSPGASTTAPTTASSRCRRALRFMPSPPPVLLDEWSGHRRPPAGPVHHDRQLGAALA